MKLSHMRGGDMIIFGFAITLVVVLNPLLDAMSYGYAAQVMDAHSYCQMSTENGADNPF